MKKKHIRIRSEVFLGLGLLFIAIALFFTGKNLLEDRKAGKISSEALAAIEEDHLYTQYPQRTGTPDPDREMPTLKIGDYEYIGVITIPSLNLELPVQSEWHEEDKGYTPSRYFGSAYANNMIICAHNFESHFAKIKNLEQGDKVVFRDIEGTFFTYEVMYTSLLGANDTEQMKNGDWDLTLFTCTVDALQRITVRCRLVPNE